MDKRALVDKIKLLEGLTNDEKADLIGLLRSHKKYGLVWEEKTEDVEERLREQLPVLNEVKEHAIVSDDADAPNHILIEGDNLEALTALSYSHEGKIDIIYIDPPYNRGEQDFIYDDKYIDKENPFKHSLWLSFMSRRLKTAKRLLSDTGVCIIHIDEHEFDALHLLLENDIFTPYNNLGLIVWNKLNPKGDAHNVAVMHEYILMFCKNKDAFVNTPNALMKDKANAEFIISKAQSLWKKIGKKDVPEEVKSVLKRFNYPKTKVKEFEIEYTEELVVNEFQTWLKRSDSSKGEKAYKYLDKKGEVFRTVSMAWPNKEKAPDDYWLPLKHPITNEECPIPSKGWRNPPATMQRLLGNCAPIVYNPSFVIQGEIAFTLKKNGKPNIPERVYYLKDNMMENVPSVYNDGSSDEQLFTNLGIHFPYPKCLSVSKHLIQNVLKNKSAIILDFFAGSGTTLHATMQLNAEDGGNRQCILVTNNENKICEEVTYERNKRVINGYTTPKGEHIEGLKRNTLRYYQTELLPREHSPKNMRELMSKATDLLCIKEDLYTEQPMFGRYKTHPKALRYFADAQKQMLILYREEFIPEIVEEIKGMDFGEKKLKVYLYSPGHYAFEDDFFEVQDKVKLIALPSAIYKAYKEVLPKTKDKLIELANEETTEGGTL